MRILIALTMLLFTPALSFAQAKIGEKAPAFTATDSHGKTHNLSDYAGKTVVLEWTNHQCPYVVKHYDTKNMQNLQRRYTEKGVVWLTVNSSAPGKQGHVSAEKANELMEEKGGAQTAYLFDPTGQIGKEYGAKATPHMFVIDPEGTLVYAGAIDDNDSSRHSTVEGARNYVAEAIDAVFASQPVKVASTEAYGCSVKYAS